MSQSSALGRPGPARLILHIPGRSALHPVSDPYERCFYAVCAALKGQPGIFAAMRAIVAAKRGNREARYV